MTDPNWPETVDLSEYDEIAVKTAAGGLVLLAVLLAVLIVAAAVVVALFLAWMAKR